MTSMGGGRVCILTESDFTFMCRLLILVLSELSLCPETKSSSQNYDSKYLFLVTYGDADDEDKWKQIQSVDLTG